MQGHLLRFAVCKRTAPALGSGWTLYVLWPQLILKPLGHICSSSRGERTMVVLENNGIGIGGCVSISDLGKALEKRYQMGTPLHGLSIVVPKV